MSVALAVAAVVVGKLSGSLLQRVRVSMYLTAVLFVVRASGRSFKVALPVACSQRASRARSALNGGASGMRGRDRFARRG